MLLSILIASTNSLSVHPRYSVDFPLTHLPGRGTDMAVKHAGTLTSVPGSSSRRAALSLTETLHSHMTGSEAECCSSQATVESLTPAKCAPLELSLDSCTMWPHRRSTAFSVSLWLLVDTDVELTAASHSISSLSTTDLDLPPPGDISTLTWWLLSGLMYSQECTKIYHSVLDPKITLPKTVTFGILRLIGVNIKSLCIHQQKRLPNSGLYSTLHKR